jgi:DNA-binding transcriptional LysR family regulator
LRVLEEAERAVDAFDRGVAAIDRHARTTAGTVRIATVPSAALTILPGVIAAFRILHPAVRLEISDADSADVLRRLQFDEADLGIASARPDQGRDGALISTEALGITCRPDGAIARAPGPASWQLLDLEPLIANPLCALVPHEGLRRREAESPMAVRNTMTLLAMVRAGQGATILPESALRSLAPDLAFLAPADPPATRRLTLYDNAHRRPGPAVAAFAAALMRHADTAPIK